jgi:PAS domain S-box-containing protein
MEQIETSSMSPDKKSWRLLFPRLAVRLLMLNTQKTKSEKQIFAGFFFALLALLFVGLISITSNNKLQKAANQIKHSLEVLQKEDEILSLLKDIETGTRGYALTGDTSFLQQYRITNTVIPSEILILEQLTADNPIYHKYIDSLKVLIDAKMEFVGNTIKLRNEKGLPGAINQIVGKKGKVVMDQIRNLIAKMKSTEGKLLNERSREEIKKAEHAKIVMLVFIFLLLGLLAFVYYILSNDITKRKRAETTLKDMVEDLRRLATVVSDSNDAVILHDLDGKILAWNRGAKMTYGYTESEALGKNVRDIVAETDRDAALTLIRRIKEGEIIKSFELRRVTKDGRILDVWLTTTLLTDENGNPVAIATTERDITERKQAEVNRIEKESAEAASHMKSEFLANMSHEIRTPMNAILGYAELLGFLVEDITQKKYLESIKSSGRGLLMLINDILDLSKIEAGKTELHFEFVDTRFFFSEFKQIFSLKVLEKELEFILDITSGTPAGIYIDEARLRQVLFNLLGNAIKFTEKGFVKLKVHTENHQVLIINEDKNLEYIDLIIEVEDSGIGISKEFQKEIFKPFVQQQEQSTKKYGGTGLGLAITLRLVELMNGTIELHSDYNEGSIFRIKIPDVAYIRNFEKSIEKVHINPSEIIFEKATLLIADDVNHNRSYLKDALSSSNLTIIEAENGLEAYFTAKNTVPDLIITDIQMPVLDGFGLLEKLKADESLKHIPVIAYSASVMKSQQKRILDSEFAGLLIKPVRVSELYTELIKILPHTINKVKDTVQMETEIALLKVIRNLPELVNALENRFKNIWKTFEVRQPISEIIDFGQQLIVLGKEHEAAVIIDYGNSLLIAADSFDIESILKLIKQYPEIIKKLQTPNLS